MLGNLEVQLEEKEFLEFAQMVYRLAGIHLTTHKRVMAENRISKRLKALGVTCFPSYLSLLQSAKGKDEIPRFVEALTTNETYFFRHPEQLRWFAATFLPERISLVRQGKAPKQLSLWSAGCSTGDEPYTLAIILLENRLALADWKLTILGTDLNEAVIAKGEQGLFGQRSINYVSPNHLRRFFKDKGDQFAIKPEVKELVRFRKHNLLESLPSSMPFHCVFLRNTLIYFDQESKKKVLSKVLPMVCPGGYLVLGGAEGGTPLPENFKSIRSWLYQRQPAQAGKGADLGK